MVNAMVVKVLGAAIALLLVGGGVGVTTVEEPRRDTASAQGENESLRRSEEPAAESGPHEQTAEGVPPAGEPGGSSPTGQASRGEAPSAGGLPDRSGPPRPGTFRYRSRQKTSTEFEGQPFTDEKDEETTRRMEIVSETGGETILRRHTPERQTSRGDDGSHSESKSYEETSWRADGTRLRARVEESGNTDADGGTTQHRSECNWEPDIPTLAFPLREGQTWSWESQCSSEDERGSSKTTQRGTARVTGTREFTLDGQAVKTFALVFELVEETAGRFRSEGGEEGNFDSRREQTNDSFFSTSLGMTVLTEITAEMTQRFKFGAQPEQITTITQEASLELLSAKPSVA